MSYAPNTELVSDLVDMVARAIWAAGPGCEGTPYDDLDVESKGYVRAEAVAAINAVTEFNRGKK